MTGLRLFLLLLFSFPTLLNAGVVKGVVRDTTGQPLPYVAVSVKNSIYGVNTNLNGAYFLELKPGSYTLVFSQLGLATQEQPVTIAEGKTTVLNVTMRSSTVSLNTFEISVKGDRDKGREIMKQVIDKRSEYWDRVNNYQCRTYQKISLEKASTNPTERDSSLAELERKKLKEDSTTRFKTKKKKERKEKELKEAQDALKDKRLNLIESVTETYFERPGRFKENVLAQHDFTEQRSNNVMDVNNSNGMGLSYGEHEIAPVQVLTDNVYLLVNDAQSADFNFYRNQIDVPNIASRPLLSPAAGNAFLNYRFDYLATFTENGKQVHKLAVNPLFRSDALFSGFIFVEDSTWAILSVNLSVNTDVLLFCREFNIIIDYEEVAPGVYLPVRREFNYTVREGKFNIIGNMRSDHSEYKVNTTFPPKLFNDEVKHFEVDAFDKDSAYWVQNRTIQLQDRELRYVHEVDSILAYHNSPEYLMSQDSAYNHLNVWSFLINGISYRNREKRYNFYIEPLAGQIIPFGVGGYRHRLSGSFNKRFSNQMLLETDGQIDYGFLNRDLRGKAGVGLTYVPLRFVRTFVRFGDFYDVVNNFASLQQVFSRSNWVRCREFSVAQRMEIVNGLFGELSFEYSDQFPITGLQLEQWSGQLFGSLNTPINFDRYVKTEIKLELKYRFRQKYMIRKKQKIILGSKYPELRFFYRKGIPGLLGSEVNFDYIEFGSVDELQLKRFGFLSWNVLFGAFLNKSNLRLLEHKYFRGSDSFIFSDPLRSFQLLGPTLSTASSFVRINFIHHFEGAFGSKIPLFGRLKITAAVGGGTLIIPDAGFYHQEVFAGLERVIRIRQQLFRLGVFAVTADNTFEKPTLTWKVGFSFYNALTRRWNY